MIMMDVSSMYGQHSTPSYNNADANYYNNYNNSSSDHSMPPHHQYGGNPAGAYIGGGTYHSGSPYEDSTYIYGVSGASTDSGVETPPSPQEHHFYPHQPNPPEPSNIINTEAGLSYTNLDYANSSNPMYHQPGYSEDYPGRAHHELLLRHHEESGEGTYPYLHDAKYHPLEEGSYHHHPHIVGGGQGNVGCMEFQQLPARYKEEMLANDGRMRPHHGMHPMGGGQSQHPVLPTYKWMQVKRNIPKPNDAVPLAEILKKYYPKLVELHNYAPRNAVSQKIVNWEILNKKVLSKLKIHLSYAEQEQLAKAVPGAIEKLLHKIKVKVDRLQPGGKTSESNEKIYYLEGISNEESEEVLDIKVKTGNKTSNQKLIPVNIYNKMEADLAERAEEVDKLRQKVEHIENMLQIKDERISDLTAQLQAMLNGDGDNTTSPRTRFFNKIF